MMQAPFPTNLIELIEEFRALLAQEIDTDQRAVIRRMQILFCEQNVMRSFRLNIELLAHSFDFRQLPPEGRRVVVIIWPDSGHPKSVSCVDV
jgi:hypothetical protein